MATQAFGPRKRRTRQHVIADLSANHFERHALHCGYSVEKIEHDYGIDLALFTYDENGEIESEQVYVQLKATDNLVVLDDGRTIAVRVDRSDLELWLQMVMPCILVVYDAQADEAYWMYVQAYFENKPDFDLSRVGESVTVYLPRANVLNVAAIKAFAQYRDDVRKQLEGAVHHDI